MCLINQNNLVWQHFPAPVVFLIAFPTVQQPSLGHVFNQMTSLPSGFLSSGHCSYGFRSSPYVLIFPPPKNTDK